MIADVIANGGEKHLPAMGSYERARVHAMADKAGLSHDSVGAGEQRHIVLKQKLGG